MERYFFLVIAESFLGSVAKCPQNKTRYHNEKKNITSGKAFFAPIWHKTWLSSENMELAKKHIFHMKKEKRKKEKKKEKREKRKEKIEKRKEKREKRREKKGKRK